jgi:hypothetical protein
VPVAFVDTHTSLVAMADPSNVLAAMEGITLITGYDVRVALIAQEGALVSCALRHVRCFRDES